VLHENAREFGPAAAAFAEVVKVLDHPDALLEVGPYNRDEIVQRAAEVCERIGKLSLQAGRFDQAVAAFRDAQKRSPNGGGRLNFNLAQVCKEQDKLADALRYLDAYLALQPSGTEAYELKADLLERLGRRKDVLPALEQAAARDRFNVGLKLLLARQYARARQTARAEQLFQEMAEGAPTPEVYRALFTLYKDDPAQGMGRVLTLFNDTLGKAG